MLPLAEMKKIKINTEGVNNANLIYDEDRIQQVIINLLSNAIKFSNEEIGSVSVYTYQNENNIEISIEDNGKGILIDELGSIFNKFYQSKNQTILKPVGSGLGLAISKQIVESHNGKIWAENIKPTGARVTFILPINNK